ncbi:hypothetical protein RHMOL_Rhmol11G0031100 [Rhododendron molle]|uniref:Uncharacterized protein n=1 Tax=Rhododendron molle TaxID=49168 RepID=A0ACC0LPM2_RHOML|nr:hypothetical protein RHMOL_Rhmol11G0031100 [Rhododendron molle]
MAFSLLKRAYTSAKVMNCPADGALASATTGSFLLASLAFCWANRTCTSAIVMKSAVDGVLVPSTAASFPRAPKGLPAIPLTRTGHQPRPVISLPPEPCAEVSYICIEEGQLSDTDAPLGRLQNGAFVLSASINDLFHQSIPTVQLNSAASLDSPYNVTDPNPSPSLIDRFQSDMPSPQVDMQAVGWAMADNMDYTTPIINEWSGLELDGFPQ